MDDWRPGASLDVLKCRAELLATIRSFFAGRDVLEVETPLLTRTTVTAPAIESFTVNSLYAGEHNPQYYLQTSPEYAMKRLLASGSGPVYQVCKAFRDGESGRHHNPEFTLLEWYRPGYDGIALMDELDALLYQVGLLTDAPQRISYDELFSGYAGLDVFNVADSELHDFVRKAGIDVVMPASAPRDSWLDIVLTHIIEPKLRADEANLYVSDFPPSQAALAHVKTRDGRKVAERFELYLKGIEVANGYNELTDEKELRQRFIHDMKQRELQEQPVPGMDEKLLQAMAHGLPQCAGAAVGLDRLVMLSAQRASLDEAMAFSFRRL